MKILVILMLVGLMMSGVAHADGSQPTLALSPTSGKSGSTVNFSGSGYTSGAEVTLVIGSDAIILTTTQADGRGNIRGSFLVPDRDTIPGASGSSLPVYAVEAGSGVESAPTTFEYTDESLQTDLATLSFELAVPHPASASTTYWAMYGTPGADLTARRLTDPDDDHVYTFSVEVPRPSDLVIRLVAGTGTNDTSFGTFPGKPMVAIKDLGLTHVSGDLTIRAEMGIANETLHITALPATGLGGGWWMLGLDANR